MGPSGVDVMRSHPEKEELIEECTCILYLLSILDPTFKKGVARLFKAMEDHTDNVAIQRAACSLDAVVPTLRLDQPPLLRPAFLEPERRLRCRRLLDDVREYVWLRPRGHRLVAGWGLLLPGRLSVHGGHGKRRHPPHHAERRRGASQHVRGQTSSEKRASR